MSDKGDNNRPDEAIANEVFAFLVENGLASRRTNVTAKYVRKALKKLVSSYRHNEVVKASLMSVRIDRAAIKVGNRVFSLPQPMRHDNIVRVIYDELGPDWMGEETEGFLTTAGDFLTRETALVIALAAGQVIKPLHLGRLYSEEMW